MMFTVCCDPKPHQDKRSILTALAEKLVRETGKPVEIHLDRPDSGEDELHVYLSPDGNGGVRPTTGEELARW